MKKIISIVLLYVSWYVTVAGAAKGLTYPGLLINGFIAIRYLYDKQFRSSEMIFLLVTSVIGSLFDSINPYLGFVSFEAVSKIGIYPVWLISLWVAFNTSYADLFLWLKGKVILAAVIGAVGGPLSFYAGSSLGALHFPDGIPVTYSRGILFNNRAFVQFLCHIMTGSPDYFDPFVICLVIRVFTYERGKKRMMNIDDLILKSPDKDTGEYLMIPRKYNHIYLLPVKKLYLFFFLLRLS